MPAPRRKSNTTIIGLVYNNRCFIGADSRISEPFYGRIITNLTKKIQEVYPGIHLAASGDGDAFADVKSSLAFEFKGDPPKSIEEAAYTAASWIKPYVSHWQTVVDMLMVGALPGKKPEMYNIWNVKGSSKVYVKRVTNRFMVLGSGEDFATTDLQNNQFFTMENITLGDGCDVVFEALKAAAFAEPGTGGTLRVVHIAPEAPRSEEFYRRQKNPFYCKSPYGKRKPYAQLSSDEEVNY